MRTPLEAAFLGALSGLFGTIILSVLSRLSPVQSTGDKNGKRAKEKEGGISATPAGVLAQRLAPGPEGLAEQFAFKLASGLFGRDVSPIVYPLGLLVHLVYGSFWGSVLGLVQSSVTPPVWVVGAAGGLVVWTIGPASLVPAMKLMGFPNQEPLMHTLLIAAGHLVYGLSTSYAFTYLWAP